MVPGTSTPCGFNISEYWFSHVHFTVSLKDRRGFYICLFPDLAFIFQVFAFLVAFNMEIYSYDLGRAVHLRKRHLVKKL
jgi:hypothetical protein